MKVNIQKLKELQNYLVQLEPLKVYDIECKSLPQLYYQLAKKINEIIKTVDIFESHNLNIITEFGEKIDKLLDENLIPELEKIMDDMYESGMLKELIDDLLLKDINKRLEFVEGASRAYLRDDWYTPRSIESCELGVNGIPSEINHGTYEQMFAWKLDKLVAEHPDIMSKSTIGMDTSGIYPIYRYIMEPEDYDRTILLLGGVHGDERTSFFGICEIMELICKEAETDGNLALIRQKTKVVAIPVVNPYGFVHNSRRNVNGVDLNRNCDYLWEEYTTTKGEIGGVYYKGIAPFSESETQAVRNVVEGLMDDNIIGVLDLHNIISVEAEKILYYPRFAENMQAKYSEMLARFNPETGQDRRILASSTVPSFSNWIGHYLGINACNPEWNNNLYGKNFNSAVMTKYVEWVVNIMMLLIKENRGANVKTLQPFTKEIIWQRDESLGIEETDDRMSVEGHRLLNSTSNTLSTMDWSKYQFSVNGEGLVLFSGYIKLYGGADCDVFIEPMVYQMYAPEQNYGTANRERRYVEHIRIKQGQEMIVPINCVLQCFHTNYNTDETTRSADIYFRIRGYCKANNGAYIAGFRMVATFIPTNKGNALEILTPVGKETYQTVFPIKIDDFENED